MADKRSTNAKKTSKTKNRTKDTQQRTKGSFFHWPDSTRAVVGFLLGCLLLLSVLYSFFACCSFFFTGGMDQSFIAGSWVDRADGAIVAPPVHNLCAATGAHISHWLINEQFGLGSFFLLFLLASVALKLMGFDKVEGSRIRLNLVNRTILSIALCLFVSLLMGWVTDLFLSDGYILWGGKHGAVWSAKLSSYIGVPGMLLLFVSIAVVISIFYSTENIRRYRKLAKLKPVKAVLSDSETSQGPTLTEEFDPAETSEVMAHKVDEDTEPNEVDLPLTDLDEREQAQEVTAVSDEDETTEVDTPMVAEKIELDGFEIEIAKGEEMCEPIQESAKEEAGVWMQLKSYTIPSIDLLEDAQDQAPQYDQREIEYNKERIINTLDSFKIKVTMAKVTVGPTITLYEVIPEPGIKISRIRSMEDDIAMSLKSEGIRIIAPMPGKGTIGIEVPNSQPRTVPMRSVLASKKYQESKFELPIAIGKTITNEVFMFDLTKMPHLLIAGATGQGKSVGLNAMIASLLFKKRPEELKFLLVDPKMLEFSLYEGIERHFLAKLPDAENAIVTDMSLVVPTLKSLCVLMDERYKLLTKARVRNVMEYNELYKAKKLSPIEGHRFMAYIVLIIDEFADLIMTAGKEVEMPITRIAQKARAAGIHMVIATQRPTTDIITGVIKANFPARIAFKVFSSVDSRTILDQNGANQLVGRGDMLFNQGKETVRLQCALMDTPESETLVERIEVQESFTSAYLLPEAPSEKEERLVGSSPQDLDPMFAEVAHMVVSTQLGSTSNIQRRFNIGYNRAGRLMDQLEMMGIVSPQDGSKPRQVLVQDEARLEAILNDNN